MLLGLRALFRNNYSVSHFGVRFYEPRSPAFSGLGNVGKEKATVGKRHGIKRISAMDILAERRRRAVEREMQREIRRKKDKQGILLKDKNGKIFPKKVYEKRKTQVKANEFKKSIMLIRTRLNERMSKHRSRILNSQMGNKGRV